MVRPRGLAMVCVAAMAWGVAPAKALTWSADLPAASDGRHVWLAVSRQLEAESYVELLHADATDEPPAWERVTRFKGRVAALAAPKRIEGGAADYVWVIFDDGAVLRVTLSPGPLVDQWFFKTRPVANLPAGVQARSVAAAGDTLWVLAQGGESLMQAELEQANVSSKVALSVEEKALDIVLWIPQLRHSAGSSNEVESVGEAAVSSNTSLPLADVVTPSQAAARPIQKNVLLRYDRGRWRTQALPADWMGAGKVSLVPPVAVDVNARPTLVSQRRVHSNQGSMLLVDTPADEGAWSSAVFPRDSGMSVVGARVGGQVVIAQRTSAEPASVDVGVARGDSFTALGTLPIESLRTEPFEPDDDTAGVWTALPLGEGVGVLAGPSRAAAGLLDLLEGSGEAEISGLTLSAVDLQGQVGATLEPMGVEPDRLLDDLLGYLPVAIAAIGATLLLVAFWRRDPQMDQPRLPDGIEVADLWRRLVAGGIDLMVSGAVVSGVMGLSGEELMQRWPGRGVGMSADFMLPGLGVVVLTALHTTVAEIITGRSLGKAVLRTRVTRLNGLPASWGALLVRGMLKPLDLIALVLLVLVVVGPHRQRLADLMARTVVVCQAPKEKEDD
ncbi:MAG: RDD family protein [Algisphaera sp.]